MSKNILITGASKGLGLEITKSILAKGWNAITVSRSVTNELNELQKEYQEKLKIIQFDLSHPDKIRDGIFKDILGLKFPIHGFVNNAAFAYDDIITNLNLDRLEKMYKVNLYAPLNIVKYSIRTMLLNRIKGSIVHISSISVHTGYKGLSMYASTKGALEAFSKNTAREWGVKKIRSNCLVAGLLDLWKLI